MRANSESIGSAVAEPLRVKEARSSARAELRKLRAALSHIDAEPGPLPLSELRDDHVRALIGSLRGSGISPARERAVLNAINALRPRPPAAAAQQPTPTDAMRALGGQPATFASATRHILSASVIALTIVTLA
jgi:hypothetical protein